MARERVDKRKVKSEKHRKEKKEKRKEKKRKEKEERKKRKKEERKIEKKRKRDEEKMNDASEQSRESLTEQSQKKRRKKKDLSGTGMVERMTVEKPCDLNPLSSTTLIDDRGLEIRNANPTRSNTPSLSPTHSLYLSNLPISITECAIVALFEVLGMALIEPTD